MRTAIIRALISVLSGKIPDRKPLQPFPLRKVQQLLEHLYPKNR